MSEFIVENPVQPDPQCPKIKCPRNPETLLQDASSMHPDLRLYMDRVIEEKKYPEQAYSSCRGIMSLARKVGVERLLKACRLASASGM